MKKPTKPTKPHKRSKPTKPSKPKSSVKLAWSQRNTFSGYAVACMGDEYNDSEVFASFLPVHFTLSHSRGMRVSDKDRALKKYIDEGARLNERIIILVPRTWIGDNLTACAEIHNIAEFIEAHFIPELQKVESMKQKPQP